MGRSEAKPPVSSQCQPPSLPRAHARTSRGVASRGVVIPIPTIPVTSVPRIGASRPSSGDPASSQCTRYVALWSAPGTFWTRVTPQSACGPRLSRIAAAVSGSAGSSRAIVGAGIDVAVGTVLGDAAQARPRLGSRGVPWLDDGDEERDRDEDRAHDGRVRTATATWRPDRDRFEVDGGPRVHGGQPASGRSAGERDDPTLGIDGRLAAKALELGAGHLVAGVVAGADERRRLDVLEAELAAPPTFISANSSGW